MLPARLACDGGPAGFFGPPTDATARGVVRRGGFPGPSGVCPSAGGIGGGIGGGVDSPERPNGDTAPAIVPGAYTSRVPSLVQNLASLVYTVPQLGQRALMRESWESMPECCAGRGEMPETGRGMGDGGCTLPLPPRCARGQGQGRLSAEAAHPPSPIPLPLYVRTRFRPSAFARYSAASARAKRSSTDSTRVEGKVATPTLIVRWSCARSAEPNCCASIRSRRRSANATPPGSLVSGSTTTNSSPP